WTIALLRFEPLSYGEADFAQHKPLILRELATVKGTLQPSPKGDDRRFAILMKPTVSDSVAEIEMNADSAGSFQFQIPAGLYHAVVIGSATATRIRSGIVAKAGQITDL